MQNNPFNNNNFSSDLHFPQNRHLNNEQLILDTTGLSFFNQKNKLNIDEAHSPIRRRTNYTATDTGPMFSATKQLASVFTSDGSKT